MDEQESQSNIQKPKRVETTETVVAGAEQQQEQDYKSYEVIM